MRIHNDSGAALAFGRGSDARLHGLPIHFNPYSGPEMGYERGYWNMGWKDVDRHWGLGAKWPVRRLYKVFSDVRGVG